MLESRILKVVLLGLMFGLPLVQVLLYYPVVITEHGHPQSSSVYKTPPKIGFDTDRKYLIYTCREGKHCGGWGDRLRGIVSTYVMAKLTNRTFLVNFTTPCHITKYLRPNRVIWNTTLSTQLVDTFLDVRNDKKFLQSLRFLDLSKIFNSKVISMTPNYDFYKALRMNPLYVKQLALFTDKENPSSSILPYVFHELFTLSPELNFRIKEFLLNLKHPLGPRLVCCQIRMGKNPTIPNDVGVKTTRAELTSLWLHLMRYADKDRYKLFITTDSEDVRFRARILFPGITIDTQGPVKHIDYQKDPGCSAFGKVILDQYLMKYCDTLIVSQSSGYGKIGALLRNKEENLFLFHEGKVSRIHLKDLLTFS